MNTALRLISVCVLLCAFASPGRSANPIVDPISIPITSVNATTGTALQIIDVGWAEASGNASPDKLAVEVSIVTNATAPGANRTVTVYYAFASAAALTAAQMAPASSNQVLAVANSASVTRVYTLPVVYISGRYLYLWLDHTARDAGSTLTLTVKVLGVGR